MRAVVQRVLQATVTVDGEVVGALPAPGLLVLLGVSPADGPREVAWMARKIWDVRILRDERSASDVGAPVLVVSQFTLYGDARKGRRPKGPPPALAPGRPRPGVRAGLRGGLRRADPVGRGGRARRLRCRHAGRLGQRRPGDAGARPPRLSSRKAGPGGAGLGDQPKTANRPARTPFMCVKAPPTR